MERAVTALEGPVLAIGFALADVPESLGSLVAGRLERLGRVGRWAGNVVAGIGNVAGAAVAGAVGILVGVPAGAVRVLGGAACFDGVLLRRGLLGLGAPIAGAVIVLVGTSLAAVQRLVGAEAPARSLHADELADLRRVFGGSVGLRNVRVVEGRSGLFGANRRPFTLGSAVYLKDVDPVTRRDVLVHEVVHVWQYQHDGPRYAAEALGAQVAYGWRGRGAYDWEAELARGRTAWTDFNREAQGSFVQHVFASEGPATQREELATGTLEGLRGARTWRWSARVGG